MPIIYCVFIMILTKINSESLFWGFEGSKNRFPYFFMDYETNGWFSLSKNIWKLGFFYWFLIIFIVVVLISKCYIKLCNKKEL